MALAPTRASFSFLYGLFIVNVNIHDVSNLPLSLSYMNYLQSTITINTLHL